MRPGSPTSTPSRPPEPRTALGAVAVVAPPAAVAALAPLLAAYQRGGRRVQVVAWAQEVDLTRVAGGADGVLVVAPRRRSPRTVAPGPTVIDHTGRPVPLGVLPDAGPGPLARFASAAAAVHDRAAAGGAPCSVAVLAQRSGRYRDLAGRILRLLGEAAPGTARFEWTADELVRDDLVEGLGCGLGLAVYVGHGRPIGWVGYRGVRAGHLDELAQPVGAVLSLACLTASRKRTGLSFAEALPLQGAAAASLAAVGPTRHVENARWALRLVRAIAGGCPTIGDLVVAAEPETALVRGYRIVGDPLAPLADAPGSAGAAAALTRRCALVLDGAAA
jgi:hypothetical protein